MSQSGVYRFKSRWGTKDFSYSYFVREYGADKRFRSMPVAEILAEYPYFYVVPFDSLERNSDRTD
jgi:hypothetical protein